jgi:hypothetical protein
MDQRKRKQQKIAQDIFIPKNKYYSVQSIETALNH